MIPSLNEVTAIARKASVGAGYGWGLSEDAARATATAWAYGLDGISALANLLQTRHSPITRSHCPLLIGSYVCDTQPIAPITFSTISNPELLLFFVTDLAKITGKSYRFTLRNAVYYTTPTALYFDADQPTTEADFTLQPAAPQGQPLSQSPRRAAPKGAWATLTRYANRTYAPTTDASRLSGAGAGLIDTD